MGICPIFSTSTEANTERNNKELSNTKPQTDRALCKPNDPHEQNNKAVNEEKKQTCHEGSLNNSKGESIAKPASTGIALSECEKKASSIFCQLNTFESSSIIVKNPKEKFYEPNVSQSDFYTLIDKVFFVRKSMDKIKVISPHHQSVLNCPYKSLLSTIYLSEGLPLESMKQISMGKVIQTKSSPVQITLKISCKQCQRKIKLTFAKSFIDVNQIGCDMCKNTGKWALNDIISNTPIWGEGRKIENNECLETVPSPLRALGCIYCMKYMDCEQLPCQCYVCKGCFEQNGTKQCHICQAID